jgi:hypothetical protein
MPADTSKRWSIAAGVLITSVAAIIAVPYFATEPLDRIESRSVEKSSSPPPAAPAAHSDASGLTWTLPGDWTQIATKQMRLASFSAGEGAECGLFLFPGGGDRLANVNRWRGQAGLPALDEAALEHELSSGSCGYGPFQWLTVRGSNRAFLAAIVPTPAGSCFVKLEAPGDRLDGLRDDFLAFTTSLRPAGAP